MVDSHLMQKPRGYKNCHSSEVIRISPRSVDTRLSTEFIQPVNVSKLTVNLDVLAGKMSLDKPNNSMEVDTITDMVKDFNIGTKNNFTNDNIMQLD
jgi:hypothetical protein